MAELKTKPSDTSVEEFLQSVPDERKREDSRVLLEMMQAATGAAPRLWGSSTVGFGDRHYAYASGREGDWFVVGFAPRKAALTIYLTGYLEQYPDLLGKLGKHKTGKGCLYINRLGDVNQDVLRELIAASVQVAREQAGASD